MPPGEAFAPWRRPVHDVFGRGFFPQGKIKGRPFVILTVQGPGVGLKVFQYAPGQDSVMVQVVVFFHVKIDGSVDFIGHTCIQDLLDHGYLFGNVTGSPGLYTWGQGVEGSHGPVVTNGVILYHFHGFQFLQTCLFFDFVFSGVRVVFQVSYVCDITDVTDLVSNISQ